MGLFTGEHIRHDFGTMTPKNSEGIAAVGVFLTAIWPIINRQIFDGKLTADKYRLFRVFLIGFNAAMIGFALHAIPGAETDRTISPGFMKFGIALFGFFLIRHSIKLFRPSGEWVRLPEHATVHQVGEMTWIGIPDEPPEPSPMDQHLTEFDLEALRYLVSSFSHGLSPFDPEFGRWISGPATEDPRSLFDRIPGNWTELFWQSAANCLISADEDGLFEGAGGAVLIAIAVVYPNVFDRIETEAASRPDFVEFLAAGYGDFLTFRGSDSVPRIEALLSNRGDA